MMTWTATLTDLRNEVSQWSLVVTYSHPDKKPIVKGYNVAGMLTDSKIKHIVKSEIAQLDSVAMVDELTLDKGAVVDLSAPVAEKKSAEILAREQWQKDYGDWNRLKCAAFEGFISQTDKRISDLYAALKAGWLDEYKDLL